MPTNETGISNFSEWLSDYASNHKDDLINRTEQPVKDFSKLYMKIPTSYGWRVTSEESLRKQFNSLQNAGNGEINRIYWLDMARQIEANYVILAYRIGELISDAVELINKRRLLTA